MGKQPLNERQVKSLRTLIKDKPLHELLLNLSVDLMLRSSDLLSLRVSYVISPNGKVKSAIKSETEENWKDNLEYPLE